MTLMLALLAPALAHPFAPAQRVFPDADLSYTAMSVDIDQDGEVDVVEWDGTQVWILWNLGIEGFRKELVGTAPSSISTMVSGGDLNGDGYQDLFFRASTMHVLLSGQTWQLINTGVTRGAGVGDMADVDADGDVDILYGDEETEIFENVLGDGTAFVPYVLSTSSMRRGFLEDMDNDGDPDIVAVTKSGTFGSASTYVYENDQAGFVWNRISVTGDADDVSVGDVDEDGMLDVITVAGGGSQGAEFSVRRQSAPMQFTSLYSNGSYANGSSRVVWIGNYQYLDAGSVVTINPANGAITKDRHGLSLVDNRRHPSGVGALVNTRGGAQIHFMPGPNGYTTDTRVVSPTAGWFDDQQEHFSIGDIDGDGDADLAVLNDRNDAAIVMRNLGRDGLTWESHALLVAAPESVTLGDLTGDGRDEVIVGHGNGITWFEDVGGTWVEHADLVLGDDVFRVHAYDADEDGDLDVLFSQYGSGEYLLEYATNTAGVLSNPQPVDASVRGWYPNHVETFDVDNDGELDIIADEMLFRSRPGPNWTSSMAFPDEECVMADLDGDGDGDRACAQVGFVQLYTSTAGVLWNSSVLAPPGTIADCGIAAGDIDADGATDLIGAGCDNGVSVLYNDGAGGFTAELLTSEEASAVLALDLDGDGDDDLITISELNGFDVHENLTIFEEYCDLPGDHDQDGLVGCADPDCYGATGCPACPPGEDADGDNICDDVDLCFGNQITGDDDLDGICNDNDVCTGADTSGDADADGICNDVDTCPDDPDNDADADGICAGLDLCVGDDYSGDADGDGLCDDSDFVLSVSNLRRGERMLARVVGAEPNATIEWWASRFGPGSQPCVVGMCGDLDQPVRIARTTADANGVATLDLTVPTSLPAGSFIFLQSLWRTGIADTSQVVIRRVR